MARLFYGSFQSDDARIHYYRTGDLKPPVILLHGFTDNGLCWNQIPLLLELEYDFYTEYSNLVLTLVFRQNDNFAFAIMDRVRAEHQQLSDLLEQIIIFKIAHVLRQHGQRERGDYHKRERRAYRLASGPLPIDYRNASGPPSIPSS
jgi:hypothetical protein